MTEVSVPAFRRDMAAVCLSVCGVTFFSLMDGQALAAVAACFATSISTASRESLPLLLAGEQRAVRVGAKLGEPGPEHPADRGVSGVALSFRPLPWQRTCGPAPEVDVLAGQAGEFGDPQPGLDGEQEKGVVAAAVPCPAAGAAISASASSGVR